MPSKSSVCNGQQVRPLVSNLSLSAYISSLIASGLSLYTDIDLSIVVNWCAGVSVLPTCLKQETAARIINPSVATSITVVVMFQATLITLLVVVICLLVVN